MTTFVLLPGAGGSAWYWHRVAHELTRAGHEVIAPDLPGADPDAGLNDYADLVVAAIGARSRITLVAQSMGAFTAALVCERIPSQIERLVFTNAMIPLPGETADEWWEHTGWSEAREAAARRGGYPLEMDLATYFLHDVPSDLADEGLAQERPETEKAFNEPVHFRAWPDVPIHAVAGKDDRLFPAEFQARLARERLGVSAVELPGGHLMALSHPRELAEHVMALASR